MRNVALLLATLSIGWGISLQSAQGETSNVKAPSKTALSNEPKSIELLNMTAHVLRPAKPDAEAIAKTKAEMLRLTALIQSLPDKAELYYLRALVHLDTIKVGFVYNEYGDVQSAKTDLDKALLLEPKHADARALRALLDLSNMFLDASKGNIATANYVLKDLDVALQQYPNWAQGLYLRGTSRFASIYPTLIPDKGALTTVEKSYDQTFTSALVDVTGALQLDPSLAGIITRNFLPSITRRVQNLQSRKIEPQQRIGYLFAAMSLSDETPSLLEMRQMAFLELPKRADAIALVTQQLEAAKKSNKSKTAMMNWLLLRAQLSGRAGELANAQRDFISAEKLMPQSIEPALSRAELFRVQNKPLEIVRVLDVAKPKAGNDARYFLLRADTLRGLKRFREAAPDYLQVTKLQPDNLAAWIEAAKAQERSAQLAAAIATLQRAEGSEVPSGVRNSMERRLWLAYFYSLNNDELSATSNYKGVALNKATLQSVLTLVKSDLQTRPNKALKTFEAVLSSNISQQ